MSAEAGSRLTDITPLWWLYEKEGGEIKIKIKGGEKLQFYLLTSAPLFIVWALPGGYLYLTCRGQNNS